jgi:hypothetical protein
VERIVLAVTILHRRRLLQAVAGSAALTATASAAAPPCCAARDDDFWYIKTYCVPRGRLSEGHRRSYSVQRRAANGAWQTSSADQFFATMADGRTTVFYVHGHRYDEQDAMQSGLTIYNGLVQPSPASPPPIRYVIWKWPSEKSALPMRDARIKTAVAHYEAYKLGWFLGPVPPARLGFVGFSLGPRLITGALHLLAGGALHGQMLGAHYQHWTRTVLWAAALHNYWLAPGRLHGRAIYSCDAMLNLYNCCDPVLKHYPRVEPERAEALGYTGMPGSWLGGWAPRFRQRNVCGETRWLHATRNYYNSPSVMASTRQYLLWNAV